MSNAFLSTVLVFKNILILSRLTYFGILFLYRWASFLESRFLHLLISTELICIPAPRCLFVSVCTFPFPSYKLTLFVSMYSPGASRSLALGPAALSALAPGIGGLLACPPGGPDGQAVVGVRHRFYHAMSARTTACFRGLSGGRTARKKGPENRTGRLNAITRFAGFVQQSENKSSKCLYKHLLIKDYQYYKLYNICRFCSIL